MPDKSVTFRDLALAAGVSIGTVSRALKNQPGLSAQTRIDILKVAQQAGYDISKLRTTKPRRLLFLFNRLHASISANPFYSVVLQGVEQACHEENSTLSLLSVGPGDLIPTWLQRHEPDAILAAGYFDPEALQHFKSTELPLVLIDHLYANTLSVNDDNLEGARLITQHLIRQGYQRIAMIVGPANHNSVALRQLGFRKTLFEAGRLADPDLEVAMDSSLPYDEAAKSAMRKLLALPERPDAVFAYNDETALNAMRACVEAGLSIPKDIAFAGYDDIDTAARNNPPLTTIQVDKVALGRRAVSLLMSADSSAQEVLLPVQLVVRESSIRGQ